MSTKIYSGFRLETRSLRDALNLFEGVNKHCTDILTQRQNQFIAETAALELDKAALAVALDQPVSNKKGSPLVEAWTTLMDRQQKLRAERRRDPAVDFEVLFRIWLCRETNAFIGYVIAEGDHEFLKVLLSTKKAVDYSYWNNTDRPEALNERQWKKRGDIWHALLDGKSGPWMDIRVPEPHPFRQVDSICGLLPTYESRVAEHTGNLALNNWFRDQKATQPDVDPMDAFWKFRDLKRANDPEVLKYVTAAKELVSNVLVREITKDMLLGK